MSRRNAGQSCGKIVYRTAKKASRALDRIRNLARQVGPIPSAFYQCDKCGHWHLTSHPHNEVAR